MCNSVNSVNPVNLVSSVQSVYSVNAVNFSVSTVSTFSQAKYLTELKCEIFQDPSVSIVSTVSKVITVSTVLQNVQVILTHLTSIMSTLHWWLNPWSGNIPEKPFWANCSICWPTIWRHIDQDWPNLETEISTQLQSDPNQHIALWVKSGDKRNLKCLKVNDNFALIFHWKVFISFLSHAKLPKVFNSYLGLIVYVKYLRNYLQKTYRGI